MSRAIVLTIAMISTVVVLGVPVWGQAPGIRITPVLQTATTLAGQPLQFPLFRNQVTALQVEIAPGGENTRHQHPVPNLVYVLEGSVTIDIEGVGQRTFTAGQAFIEPVNTWHRALNPGTTVHKAVAVFSGEAGKSNFVRPPGLNPVGVRATTVLQTTTTAIGQPILFPAFPSGIVAVLGEFAPGAVFPRHLHPVNHFAYMLEGSLRFAPEGHLPVVLTAGQAIIGAPNTWHTDANPGTTPNKFLLFFWGEEGKPNTIFP